MTKQQLKAIAAYLALTLDDRAPHADASDIDAVILDEESKLLKGFEVVKSTDSKTLMLEARFDLEEDYQPIVTYTDKFQKWRVMPRF